MGDIPAALRIAVYNAMGGWGPYTVRQIDELFRTYGFTEQADVPDAGGARRTLAERFQRCINWEDPDAQRRYLMLVEDVMENYESADGEEPSEARALRRALRLSRVQLPSEGASASQVRGEDLWRPRDAPRIFISHLASRKVEVHELARMMQAFGFACFVAHDAIEPSRAWQREIERGLGSCDLLVAYITPRFGESSWTDQEVGWALGRGSIAIPIAVDGANPYGFIGSVQAVKRAKGMTAAAVSRLTFRAIVDAAVSRPEELSRRLTHTLPALVVNATAKATSSHTAKFFFDVLLKVPQPSLPRTACDILGDALKERTVLQECEVDGRTLAAYVSELSTRR